MYSVLLFLRYYVTLKVRKCESLFYKLIHFCKKLPLALDCKQSKYSQQTYNMHIFLILDVAFAVLFLFYFQKLKFLVVKKFWTNFCCFVLLYLWAQKVCFRFLKPYFKLEVLIFLSFTVSFLLDMFKWKAPSLTKKTSVVKSETHFSREAIEN